MKIITVRKKEGLICSLCHQTIKTGEEAIEFFNRGYSVGKEVKKGHIPITQGEIHFRHLLCQYNKQPRKVNFEQFIKELKFQLALHDNKKKLKAKTVEESAKLFQVRVKRFTPETHTPLWYDYQ